MMADGGPGPGARDGLRVLHCYSGNLYGGIETLLATLARRRDVRPDLIPEFALCFEGRLADELRAAGATPHRLEPVRFSRPWTVLRARRRLARLLAERPFDVVVAHACWPHALFAPEVRRAGRPLAFWMHDGATGRHWIERLAARTPPDLVLANSRSTAATLPQLFPTAPAEVLYYPVEPPPAVDRASTRARVQAALGAGLDDVVIVQVSRMEPWKGHALLIRALTLLRDRPGWVAWIAGGAQRPHELSYLDRLRDQAQAAGIGERVRFLGQRSDVPDLLAAADIHCQPNLGPEPFGIAFVEALYAGLPVVSTRMGGAAEIVSEDCGRLVPPDDAPALAEALGALIDDPSARARLGAAGPARARALCDPALALGRLHDLLAGLARVPRPSTI
jgi:glycosyltransferase involved in cell wall biosynthesis